jgi:phosphohistidine phosphatase
MDVYLMRHGEARPDGEDPQRPLTEAGRLAVERVARRLALDDPQLDGIYHSGILRARQTAEVLAAQLDARPPVHERSGLRPLDPVEPVARWLLEEASEDAALALVGHLPFLEHLAAQLIVGDAARQVLMLPAAGLVKLVPKEGALGFAVAWVIAPEIA